MRKLDDYLLITHTPGGRQYPRLDCWGLIVDYYRENLGITLDEHTDLTHATMNAGFAAERGRFREVSAPEDGDIVAFSFRTPLPRRAVYSGKSATHVRAPERQI